GYWSKPLVCVPTDRNRVARRLRDQPLEATLQHVAHHRKIIAGREVGRANIELAILILAEALGAGDDHGANRVRALDVAVVVDLDAARRSRQSEAFGERGPQPALRGPVRKLAAQRPARVGERMVDELLLLAAGRACHFNLAAALGGECLRQQLAFREGMRDQNDARRRLVVVELRQERTQHLAGVEAAVGLGKISAVTPVLTLPAEE